MFHFNLMRFLLERNSTDDTGNTVKPLTLAISAFYGGNPGKIHLFRYPAFRAVNKGRGFYKSRPNAEFPAVDTESTVFHRLFFPGETLNLPFCCRQNPVIMFTHEFRRHLLYSFVKDLYNTMVKTSRGSLPATFSYPFHQSPSENLSYLHDRENAIVSALYLNLFSTNFVL